MSTAWTSIRRLLAQEMGLWGGKVDGSTPGPATFSQVDPGGSLYVVYDVFRPEPDAYWDGGYICINPGGSGNPALATIWRRIADDNGFINSTGALTLTSPLPSSAYAATTMTYELFNSFKPEDWMNAANDAMKRSYPARHRLVAFEVMEDDATRFYDYAHLAAQQQMADPAVAPTVNVIADPGGRTNTWAAGTYKIAYNIYNAAGETLISPTTSVTLTGNQVVEIEAITVPEQAIGINYFCTPDPGGSVLAQLSPGAGILSNASTDNVTQIQGIADSTTFIVPVVRFWGPPGRSARTNPGFNTSSLDPSSMQCRTIKRRTNPGQFPEHYVDLNSNWWREVGGTTINLFFDPVQGKALRFECTTIPRLLTTETDTTDEPTELLVAGGMMYLFNQLMMSGSAQNVDVWKLQVAAAQARWKEAVASYRQKGPRRTMRTPKIQVSRWYGNGWDW